MIVQNILGGNQRYEIKIRVRDNEGNKPKGDVLHILGDRLQQLRESYPEAHI